MADLAVIAADVRDAESFLAFVDAMAVERAADAVRELTHPSSLYDRTAAGWENVTIEDFLSAAARYARDADLFGPTPTWRGLALFLLAGKGYE